MNPVNLVCTNTTRFIIPMLFSNINYIKVLNEYFIDSYNFDYYEPKYDNKVIIVKTIDIPPEINIPLLDKYIRQNHYCFVYNIPDEFKRDYEALLKEKFNLLSTKYYKNFKAFWSTDENPSNIKYNPIREMYRVC